MADELKSNLELEPTYAGVLGRLRTNTSGNVLALAGAMIVPMTITAACAVDISRLYIVRSELQAACDAGALAGRRSMTSTTLSTAANTVATNMFNANFSDGTFGSSGRSVTYTADSSGNVSGTATVNVPATISRVIGFGTKTLTATCRAELQLPDTDVMFALDTTGSMNTVNRGDSVSRIAALRTAVTNFYTTLQSAAASGARIRYGFVPFSSTVNVGYLLQRDWMVDTATYQSREPDGTSNGSQNWSNSTETTYSPWVVISGNTTTTQSYGSYERCVAPSNTYNYTDRTSTATEPYPGGGTKTTVTRTATETGSYYSAWRSGGNCIIEETKYNTRVSQRTEVTIPSSSSGTWTWTNYFWNYKPVSYDVSALKGSNGDGTMARGLTFTARVGYNHGLETINWAGCIEERKSLRPGEVAANAGEPYDANIDLVPSATNDDTRWRPFLPQLVFKRGWDWYYPNVLHTTNDYQRATDMGQGSTCPSESRKLGTITSRQLTSYLNGLTPGGYTYLDIGMLWAARLVSPTGIFASENASSTPVSRNIIYMTDGEINTELNNYHAYGLDFLDRRRVRTSTTPTNSNMDDVVSDSFDALCTATKAKGITIWVVAFGTTLNEQLRNCSTTGRAYQANNSSELNSAFQDIASRIAQLRITQ